jgi:hypothetical protein
MAPSANLCPYTSLAAEPLRVPPPPSREHSPQFNAQLIRLGELVQETGLYMIIMSGEELELTFSSIWLHPALANVS